MEKFIKITDSQKQVFEVDNASYSIKYRISTITEYKNNRNVTCEIEMNESSVEITNHKLFLLLENAKELDNRFHQGIGRYKIASTPIFDIVITVYHNKNS